MKAWRGISGLSNRRRVHRAHGFSTGLQPFRLRHIFCACIATGLSLVSSAAPSGAPTILGATHAPTLTLGPEFVAFSRPTGALAAAADPNGLMHLLAMTADTQDVYHLVVGPTGVQQQGFVAKSAAADSVAAAFDSEGVLRVVVGDQHLALRGGAWSTPESGPPCERLVRAGALLLCAYAEFGGKAGARARVDVVVVPPLVVPIPMPYRKVVLACLSSAGWVDVALVEPTTKRDTAGLAIGADDSGAAQILYVWSSRFLSLHGQLASARMPAVTECNAPAPERRLLELQGTDVVYNLGQNSDNFDFDIAVDASSGKSFNIGGGAGLMLESFVRQQDLISPPQPLEAANRKEALSRIPRLTGPVRVSPAGADSFHVMLKTTSGTFSPVDSWYYTNYKDGRWSAVLELGRTTMRPWWHKAVTLTSGKSGQVLAVWPERPGLVARWVQLAQ